VADLNRRSSARRRSRHAALEVRPGSLRPARNARQRAGVDTPVQPGEASGAELSARISPRSSPQALPRGRSPPARAKSVELRHGLQNRSAGVARRWVGSIPAPLRSTNSALRCRSRALVGLPLPSRRGSTRASRSGVVRDVRSPAVPPEGLVESCLDTPGAAALPRSAEAGGRVKRSPTGPAPARRGAVCLRTADGGATWRHPLRSAS
jgi:hypothetical protein